MKVVNQAKQAVMMAKQLQLVNLLAVRKRLRRKAMPTTKLRRRKLTKLQLMLR